MYRDMRGEIKRVAVVGSGAAGMTAASVLARLGIQVTLFEREDKPGGHLRKWHALFPDRDSAKNLLSDLEAELECSGALLRTGIGVSQITPTKHRFLLDTDGGNEWDAVILATGFRQFNATVKEEYGYGIYPRVITSSELEERMAGDGLVTEDGPPASVAFVHCVGSRDAKVGNHYCSKVCCVTGVKQAIGIRERYPGCRVSNFYMDLRMYGSGYEELYREAQEKWGVSFIRGRVSEAAGNAAGAIQLKAEDTLLGRPVMMKADWLVLLTGMEPPDGTQELANRLGIKSGTAGFLAGNDRFLQQGTGREGIFMAGACTGPATLPESIAQGRAVAVLVSQYLYDRGKIPVSIHTIENKPEGRLQ
jgi:heterodisulfide reductase subunit A2